MDPFLESSKYIDSDHPEVMRMARELAQGCADAEAVARNCFLFVRDEIRHSWDWRQNPVTCTASETLRHGTGFCYAKSHLLAALLRACGIPAGLCYQRLQVEPGGERTCLHGLNGVLLPGWGWYRMDARGNKEGVDARFQPPEERLAFVLNPGEIDLPGVWPEPLEIVTRILTGCATVEEAFARLPDLDPVYLPPPTVSWARGPQDNAPHA